MTELTTSTAKQKKTGSCSKANHLKAVCDSGVFVCTKVLEQIYEKRGEEHDFDFSETIGADESENETLNGETGGIIFEGIPLLAESDKKISSVGCTWQEHLYSSSFRESKETNIGDNDEDNDGTSQGSDCTTCSSIDAVDATACWTSSGQANHNKGAPLFVVDPDKRRESTTTGSSEGAEDDPQKVLGEILAKSRSLPGTSHFASLHIMVNQERTKRLTAPLTRLRELDALARQQAEAMARHGELFHGDPLHIHQSLTHKAHSHRLGANIARGCCLPDIHKAMMKKKSDKNNILDRRYCHCGMASVRGEDGYLYVCELFRG